jgi:hypothetical protein
MTQSTTKSLLERALATDSATHPHLSSPINSHALRRERATAIQGLEGLMAYQQFLADARAAKAERRRTSKAFERHVQAQSRQALADLDGFIGSALLTARHVNQANYWQTSLRRAAAVLNDTGPITAQNFWRDIRGRPDVMSSLVGFGFSDSMAAMSDKVIATTDAVIKADGGAVEVATRRLGTNDEYRSVTLTANRGRPKTLTELLSRQPFDQVAAAYSRFDNGAYIPMVSIPWSQCEPNGLVTLAAFTTRQLVVEHVRKLEDNGLTTYVGGEPGTVIALLLIGLTLYLTGLWIGDACTDPQNIDPPSDTVCVAGGFLTLLGVILIAIAVFGAAAAAPAWAGLALSTSAELIFVGAGVALGGFVGLALHLNASIAGAYDAAMGFEAENLGTDQP